MQKLGEVIAAARYAKGLSIRDVQKETGIHHVMINRLEVGKVDLSAFRKIIAVAKVLGLRLDDLAALDLGRMNERRTRASIAAVKRMWKDPKKRAALVATMSANRTRRHKASQHTGKLEGRAKFLAETQKEA